MILFVIHLSPLLSPLLLFFLVGDPGENRSSVPLDGPEVVHSLLHFCHDAICLFLSLWSHALLFASCLSFHILIYHITIPLPFLFLLSSKKLAPGFALWPPGWELDPWHMQEQCFSGSLWENEMKNDVHGSTKHSVSGRTSLHIKLLIRKRG